MQKPDNPLEVRPVRFVRRGRIVSVDHVDPNQTLLDLLRTSDDPQVRSLGTKEGCAQGDCGACTVVVGEYAGGHLTWRAINSCIRLATSIDGCALWSVEDIVQPDGALHPVQQAMVDTHATQCGFCTPGFVMSMYALYQSKAQQPASRDDALEALSGNLCRCTGYRPIVQAVQVMHEYPAVVTDTTHLKGQLEAITSTGLRHESPAGVTLRPATLAQLLRARSAMPAAQIIAGCTDVGLWITKMFRRFDVVLDVTGVHELAGITMRDDVLKIGAAARLVEAFAAIERVWPQTRTFHSRFAGLPIRQSGTLGGNIANGSPIGDSMPLLIALGATVVLQTERAHRELPIESLYTGYRRNVIAADEVLTFVRIPLPGPQQWLRVYKVSKRFEDDISAVCLALDLTLAGESIVAARLGVGGMAAIPMRAPATEAALTGKPFDATTIEAAAAAIRAEFSPLDDMRASAAYRRQVIGNLLWRALHDRRGKFIALDDPHHPPTDSVGVAATRP